MKKIIIPILLVALLLSGCNWLDGEYHSIKPHASEGTKLSDDLVTVSNYNELKEALLDMVTTGRESSTFYVTGFGHDEVDQHMNTAIMHVFQNSPIGAYAVDEITYDSGTSGGIFAVAVDVTYHHGRQEILRIKKATNMDGVKNLITNYLHKGDSSVVIKVDNYEELDVEHFVRDYVNENPHRCMELPQVTAVTYPDRGDERVIEVTFSYQSSRETLQNMQSLVSSIFSAAELYVQGSEEDQQKYAQLYAFLMERFDYKFETSITPAYSLLRYGVGDSKAFAQVYSVMCRNAYLECRVVSGTRNGEAHYWNLIRIDDVDYHIDLLACNETGEFMIMLPEEMTGYVWDYSDYQ